jgi:outer membrane protein assembly factor BamB
VQPVLADVDEGSVEPAAGTPPTATPVPTATATTVADPWPQFGHDPRHTGRSGSRLPGAVTERWRYQTFVGDVPFGPVVSPDRTVYAAGGGFVFALDPNGVAKWRAPVGASSGQLAVGSDGTVYASGGDVGRAGVIALAPDGAVRWASEALTAAPGSLPEPALALGPDGTVYVAVKTSEFDTAVHALDRATGEPLWANPPQVGLVVASAPAVASNGFLYVGNYQDQGYVEQISTDGAVQGRSEALGYISSSPAIGADGTLYVGSSNGIHAITPTGLVRWTVPTHAPVVYSSPAIGADGTVYVGAGDRLYAVSATGTLKWSVTTCLPGGTIGSAPAVGADGSIAFQAVHSGALISAALCAVDEAGSTRWQFVTQGQFNNSPRVSSPAIGGDGLVYVASPDGHIYAIQGPVFRGLAGRVLIPLGPRNVGAGG